MSEMSKPAHSHSGDDQVHGGSCCGGADARTKPLVMPPGKAALAPASASKTKPAGSSGCCGG